LSHYLRFRIKKPVRVRVRVRVRVSVSVRGYGVVLGVRG